MIHPEPMSDFSQQPLVSIILPTYNRASLLPRAIQSVIDQTYLNWELIIWDDGSLDETASVIKSFNDTRIKYFYKNNKGMSYALNNALKHSSGDYIAFLDDDDFWVNNKLQDQLEFLIRNPSIDLIFGNFSNINVEYKTEIDGFKQTRKSLQRLKTKKIGASFYIIEENFLESIIYDNYIAFDSVLARKSIIEKIGYFNESLRNGMDFEYWWRFGIIDGKAAFTSNVILVRTKYPKSLSSASLIAIENQLKMLNNCKEIALSAGKPDLANDLRIRYRNAWQLTILESGKTGDRMGALKAFFRTLRFGFSPGSVRLLVQALIGRKQLSG